MEEEYKNKVELIDRRRLFLEGVEYVGNFNENEILLDTNMGSLCLRGREMHITELNLDKKKIIVEGFISLVQFDDNKTVRGSKAAGKNFWGRIFK